MMPAVKKETEITKLDHSIPALSTESAEENPAIVYTEGIAC